MKYYIGVELGVTNLVAGVVDKNGKLLRKDSIPTVGCRPYGDILKDVADLINKVLEEESIDIKSVKYIGVGCPGIPNHNEGTIVRNYSLNFVNTPVRAELQKYFHMPVFVENSANCVALAESVSGAAEEIEYSVTIKIGNGIGGGVIINNKIYSGFNFAGAEMGHMVISIGGELCTCGRKGCWEAYASAIALIKQTAAMAEKHKDSLIYKIVGGDLSKITVATPFEAAKQGDAVAGEVLYRYYEYLGEGIVNIVNLLMPQVIIISGEISKQGEYLLKPLRVILDERIYSKEIPQPELKTAELGSAAIVIGAAMLGLYKDNCIII
jgi:Transcriptional regulator/sugar kinase